MDTQLHLSILPELTMTVGQVCNVMDDNYPTKPEYGGLWTSTYTGVSSAFVEYIRQDKECSIANRSWWLLTPSPSARIYHIDTTRDLEALQQCYRLRNGGLHFDALRIAYDGLHLSHGGCAANWQSKLVDEWSCESTIWFHWCFSAVQKIETPILQETQS